MVRSYGLHLYAYQDDNGNWRAGERSGKATGQFVSDTYAKQVRGSIIFHNKVVGLMSNKDPDTPDTYADAQQVMSEFVSLTKEITKIETQQSKGTITQEEAEQRLKELDRELQSKREKYGS